MKKMIAEERTICDFEGCEERASLQCTQCSGDFCYDHSLGVRVEYRGNYAHFYLCLKDFDALFGSALDQLKDKGDTWEKVGRVPESNREALIQILQVALGKTISSAKK